MDNARGQLEARRPGDAVDPMTDALDQLRQGANSVIREMLEALGTDPGLYDCPNPFARVGRDPFGRPQNGFGILDDSRVEIPTEFDIEQHHIWAVPRPPTRHWRRFGVSTRMEAGVLIRKFAT